MTLFAYHAATPDLFDAGEVRTRVRLVTRSRTAPDETWLHSEIDNEMHLRAMRQVGAAGAWRLWEAELTLDTAEPTTRYAFKLLHEGRQHWLTAAGPLPYPPAREQTFRHAPAYRPAAWVWERTFYQIFPDRFFDGDPSNNVRDGEYRYEGEPVVAKGWGERPDRRQGAREFFGGDLQGVLAKLDYLEALGVGALYLNPIFTSPSSHKYDTVDYHHVDPHLGGDAAFAALCGALHDRGMRIVLDAVVNHTSERHPWFDRYGEHGEGAYGGADSPTRSFYTFPEGGEYVGWLGVDTLPVLDYRSEALRTLVYEGDEAILRRWMRPPYDIDGWRFDVIHMLGEGAGARNNAAYVRAFRAALREEDEEAYVLGEHFADATRWLQGDQEDGSMNYFGFQRPLLGWLGGVDGRGHPMAVDAADLDAMWRRARAVLPHEIALSQFNLLGSHDTPRMLTLLGGDRERLRLAFTALLTYVGAPCIYYGDEIGMEGGGDPDCRGPFPWDEARWDVETQGHVRRLAALRARSAPLRRGGFLTLVADGDVLVYARLLDGEAVVVALNRGEAAAPEVPLWPLAWSPRALERGEEAALDVRDALGDETFAPEGGVLRLPLPAGGWRVLSVAAR